ncbi:MAG TPA: arginase family protein [Polyangiaceae bacterium]|nr:arginase family protein [Polyangiaceae bacterium]
MVRTRAVPFAVGGDHSIALPAMRAVAKEHGPLAVIHVDAHLDTSDDAVWGDAYRHGTPLRHAIEEGLVERGQLHQVGVRAPWGYPEEGTLAANHGAVLHDAEAIAERGAVAVGAQIAQTIGAHPVYLTFDIDGVDPAFAPGTGTPVPSGLTSREAISLLRSLAGIRLVAMDLVEVCPALDHADVTAHLAAQLLYEGSCATRASSSWAFTAKPNPRRRRYERAGGAFVRSLRRARYRVMQATDWGSMPSSERWRSPWR